MFNTKYGECISKEKIINSNLKNSTLEIVIYGKNNSDKSVEKVFKINGTWIYKYIHICWWII